jgi:hypothetical protein
MSKDEQMHHEPMKNKREKTEVSELKNTYRDNLKIDALRADVDALKVDLTNFVGALLQSGIVELVKDEEGNIIYKINKVVLVDESVQQD